MPIVEVAIALAYLVSLVLAADHVTMTSGMRGTQLSLEPVNEQGNNVMVSESSIISKSDVETLVHTIEDMMARNPNVPTISNEDLFGLLARAATNPAVYSNAAGIISAATSGNTGALANNVVGLLGAMVPATPTSQEPVAEPPAAST